MNKTFRRNLALLNPADVVTIIFLSILTIVNIAFASRISVWWILTIINYVASVCIFWFAYKDNSGHRLFHLFHMWYALAIILLVFKEIYFMNRAIHNWNDYDEFLIQIDRWIFGVNPTQWIGQFANPVLTEILQIAYASYYFLFIYLGYELFRTKRLAEFSTTLFFIFYGFYLSYIGYLLLPSVGPRFTLHNFQTMNTDLPGIFFTNFLRAFVNTGESIPFSVSNPINFVQRDVFPSGHTQLTLVVMYLSLKFRIRFRWMVIVLGSLLIISTVYERYHYVVDVFGGIIFWGITIWTAPKLINYWNTIRNRLQQSSE